MGCGLEMEKHEYMAGGSLPSKKRENHSENGTSG